MYTDNNMMDVHDRKTEISSTESEIKLQFFFYHEFENNFKYNFSRRIEYCLTIY